MTGSKIHIIPKEQVEQVEWKDDGATYDRELFALGDGYDEFIIFNPLFDHYKQFNFDSFVNKDEKKCTLMSIRNVWAVKHFYKTWQGEYNFVDLKEFINNQYNTISENVEWIYNPDLYSNLIFRRDPRKLHLKNVENLQYQMVWYIHPLITATEDKIWALKCQAKGAENLEQLDMGYLSVIQKFTQRDVIFISYNEVNAEANWQRLLSIYPNAKRINNVKGIVNAHKAAAKLATTDMFYVVDGDAYISENFKFDFQPSVFDRDYVYVWKSINPINGLEYGYGGVKLIPKVKMSEVDDASTDVTTSISENFKIVPLISNITAFNTSEFNTWRSAFRECAKLASQIIDRQESKETAERLNVWCTVGVDKPYGDWAIKGAVAGRKYGSENIGNQDKLILINDYDWLYSQFKLDKDTGL